MMPTMTQRIKPVEIVATGQINLAAAHSNPPSAFSLGVTAEADDVLVVCLNGEESDVEATFSSTGSNLECTEMGDGSYGRGIDVNYWGSTYRGVAAGSETQFTITFANNTGHKIGAWALLRGEGKGMVTRGVQSDFADHSHDEAYLADYEEVRGGINLAFFMLEAQGLNNIAVGSVPSGWTEEELVDGASVSRDDSMVRLLSKPGTVDQVASAPVESITTSASYWFGGTIYTSYPSKTASNYPIIATDAGYGISDFGETERTGSSTTAITYTFGAALDAGDYICVVGAAALTSTRPISSISVTGGTATMSQDGSEYNASTTDVCEWWSGTAGGGETAITLNLATVTANRLFGYIVMTGASSKTYMTPISGGNQNTHTWPDRATHPRGLDYYTIFATDGSLDFGWPGGENPAAFNFGGISIDGGDSQFSRLYGFQCRGSGRTLSTDGMAPRAVGNSRDIITGGWSFGEG
jgi:hypothetical protein